MRILDILNSPWSITPDRLSEIRAVYQTHLRGPRIDVNWKGMQSQIISLAGDNQDEPYDIRNGVAVIPVQGVLTKGLSFFSFLFGGSSMQAIGDAVRQATEDLAVKSILLDIDSPGGTVAGTQELTQIVRACNDKKEIVAYSDGMLCSAAYWIGSAASKIYISGNTVSVGSIGVVATHIDQSKYDEMEGANYTEITAGRYKRMASPHKPLSKEGAQYLQDQVDYLYSAFIADVAKNRGVSEEKALEMADGRLFIGQQAIEAGLVDGVSTFDGLIDRMAAGDAAQTAKEENMDSKELKEKFPAVYQEIHDAGKVEGAQVQTAAVDAVKTEAAKAGAEAERQRIISIRKVSVPGCEAIIDDAIADGVSAAGDVALKIVAYEKTLRAQAARDAEADAAAAGKVPNAASPEIVGKPSVPVAKDRVEAGDKLDKIARGIATEKKCSYGDALNQAMAANPALAKIYNGKEG